MSAPGDRVVAVRDADDSTVRIFGRGVYAGDFPRPGSGNWSEEMWEVAVSVIREADERPPIDLSGWYDERVAAGHMSRADADAEMAAAAERAAAERARPIRERARRLLERMDLNPRIDLDDGSVVWGFECWWGDEAGFDDNFVKGRAVVTVATPQR